MKRVTEEQKAEILKLKGEDKGPFEISKRLVLPLGNVKFWYYRERLREYMRRPKVRKRLREYMREYKKRPEVRERQIKPIIDVFTDFETGHTFEDIKITCGGKRKRIEEYLNLYVSSGVLALSTENGKKVYRLNPNSPLHIVADGFYKKAEKELFGND